jgi:hypothetical protein
MAAAKTVAIMQKHIRVWRHGFLARLFDEVDGVAWRRIPNICLRRAIALLILD